MNNKKKLDKAIKSAREANEMVSLLLDDKAVHFLLDDVETLANSYIKVISAYVSIILEHHRSIIELTNVRQLSALALIRPLYESYIRTIWLTCASDKTIEAVLQLVNHVEDGNFPTLRVMCEDIDNVFNNIGGTEKNISSFASDLENNKRLFHSFTHGGAELVAVVNNRHHKYTYKEMMNILDVTNFYMLRATHAYVGTTGNSVLIEKVRVIMLQYNLK